MKRFLRCTCLILVMSMLLTVPAFAAETVDPRASSYFMKCSVYVGELSGTTFEAWFDVTGTGIMDVIGAEFIKIQQSSDDSNWTTVKTFSRSSYSSLIDTDTVTHAAGVSYTATGGYYYRAYVQLYAEKGIGCGYWDRYSASIYIPAN